MNSVTYAEPSVPTNLNGRFVPPPSISRIEPLRNPYVGPAPARSAKRDDVYDPIPGAPGRRLFAKAVDHTLIFGIPLGLGASLGALSERVADDTVAGVVLALGVLVALGWWFAASVVTLLMLQFRGQTVGKWMARVKIVRLDGSKPSLLHSWLIRTWGARLISAVPLFGALFGFVNVVSIFREDRRMLHDLFAQTRVVAVIPGE